MRAALVAIFVFAALLSAGHYVGAPFYCRGGIAIPTLDAKSLCGADMHLNRAGSVLLYFSSVAVAVFFGVVASLFGGGRAKTAEKPEAKHAETFEEILARKEAVATQSASPSAPNAIQSSSASEAAKGNDVPAPTPVVAKISETKISDTKTSDAEAAVAAAILSATGAKAEPKPDAAKENAPAAASAGTMKPAAEPDKKSDKPVTDSAPAVSAAEAITIGLAAAKNGSRGTFDGTNEELLERFRELKKQEGVNAIAQAQRLLDESTLSALSKGIDPKQHLSQIAHLVLAEDPDLKSGVVRGVVVHIAARLKELGVAKQNIPGAAKGAA